MATTNSADSLAERIIPTEYSRGQDLDRFIKQCHRYFNAKGTKNEKAKENSMFCLLDVDLHDAYEKTSGKVSGFEKRLRLAFEEPKDLLGDLEEMMNYRKGREDTSEFIQKVRSLVKKVLAHDLDEEKLTALVLVHAAQSKELEREICMKKLTGAKEIEDTLLLVEKVEKKIGRGNTMNYAMAVGRETRRMNKPILQERQARPVEHSRKDTIQREQKVYDVECWTCHKKGHLSRNCTERRPIICYGCGNSGHIRRECKIIRCYRCGKIGHKANRCYSEPFRSVPNVGTNKISRENSYGDFGPRRGYKERRINAVEGENETYSLDDRSVYNVEPNNEEPNPKVRAPLSGELVGAIY